MWSCIARAQCCNASAAPLLFIHATFRSPKEVVVRPPFGESRRATSATADAGRSSPLVLSVHRPHCIVLQDRIGGNVIFETSIRPAYFKLNVTSSALLRNPKNPHSPGPSWRTGRANELDLVYTDRMRASSAPSPRRHRPSHNMRSSVSFSLNISNANNIISATTGKHLQQETNVYTARL
ncbi:hypothetical protein EVAR_75969_1 [Eumeta japonica]|uniref:Uncharacterized protein n=1 Tax=Eumeta variegata TaxID=151549 RepID=A0A4C1UBE4_EUMVA|nr:hypothetical protein EVAR_75969_1 [Eumeta japonica]